ncbi:hypothetical protein M2284_003264 [Rhodococcus sp. LBL1]|nr:hypothetical protein [Rhodococcus sp. LBL1]MDH6685212.1 hypothetical protein [Rhodococcus sp. LBL2]
MSYDFLAALRTFVMGMAPVLGGSLTGLNTMSGNSYS